MTVAILPGNIRLMYLYAFVNRFVFAFPIKTLFFVEITGSFLLAMSIFAVQEWSGVLFEIPTGCLSDRWGRRKVAIIGAAARLACFALYAFAPGYAVFFAGAVCYGLSEALASGNNEAILYDSLKEHNQERLYHSVFARFSGLEELALGLGALASVPLAFISLRFVMIASLPSALITLILIFRLKEPQNFSSNSKTLSTHLLFSLKVLWHNRKLRNFALGSACQGGINEAAFDFNSVFVKQFVPVWSLGIFRAAGHIFSSFGMFVSTAVVRRLGAAPTLLTGFLADNLINLFSILVANIWTPFIRTLAPLAEGPAVPLLSGKIQNELSSDIRATVPSVINLGESVIYGTFALAVGFLADSLSPFWALVIAYSFCTVSNIFFVNALRAEKEEQLYPGSQLQVS